MFIWVKNTVNFFCFTTITCRLRLHNYFTSNINREDCRIVGAPLPLEEKSWPKKVSKTIFSKIPKVSEFIVEDWYVPFLFTGIFYI